MCYENTETPASILRASCADYGDGLIRCAANGAPLCIVQRCHSAHVGTSLVESERNCAHIRHTLRAPWYCSMHPCTPLHTTAHIPALNCAPLRTSLRSTAHNCAHIRQNCVQCCAGREKNSAPAQHYTQTLRICSECHPS